MPDAAPPTHPPESAAAFMATCERVLADLPEAMRSASERVVTVIQDYAEPEILAEFGMTHPMELTGLYMGLSAIHESVTFPSPDSPMIFLYREPILAEWRERADVPLHELVAHVFIHELAHHFGWSDEEIDDRLESD